MKIEVGDTVRINAEGKVTGVTGYHVCISVSDTTKMWVNRALITDVVGRPLQVGDIVTWGSGMLQGVLLFIEDGEGPRTFVRTVDSGHHHTPSLSLLRRVT